jgi:FixJ family two-component response regulator
VQRLALSMPEDLKQGGVGLAFVLDDEPKVGAVVCKMLSGMGIGARRFVTAEEFLPEVTRCNPD